MKWRNKNEKNTCVTRIKQINSLDEARKIRESKQNDYFVSIHDSYFSKNKNTGKVIKLKPVQVDNRYFKIFTGLRFESVHRLVLEAFDPDFTKDCHVNHISGDFTDSRLINLEICTPQENILHRDVNKQIDITVSIADIKRIQEQYNVKKIDEVVNVINNININILTDYEPKTFNIKFKDQQEK